MNRHSMSNAVGAVLVAAFLALCTAGVASGATAPMTAPTVTISQHPGTVRPLGTATITGTLLTSSSRAPIPGGVVELWVRPVGSSAWAHVRNARAGAQGKYVFKHSAAQSSVLQTRYPGSAGHGAAVSSSLVLRVANGFDAVYIRGCNPTGDGAYTDIAAVGRTGRGAAGTVADLQGGLYFEGFGFTWHTIASTIVGADGSFAAAAANPFGGDWNFRWVLEPRVNIDGAESAVYTGVRYPQQPGCYAFPGSG